MRNGEIACYKQFLLFSQCFLKPYIFSVLKRGIVWQWVNNIVNSSSDDLDQNGFSSFWTHNPNF